MAAATPGNALRVSTTLRLGERVLVRCDDGLLSTEYVLFDATDIVLRATDPVTVRETGYITTARDALARLAALGVTPALADEAGRAMAPDVIASFKRSSALVALAPELGASELFDGAIYRASTKTYEGVWLDLRSIASALPPSAAALLQALHLAAAIAEVARNTPLHLSTANATRDRRPGERTHRRVRLDGVGEILSALRSLRPNPNRSEVDPQRDRLIKDALLARVRERVTADAGPTLRVHLGRLESALSAADAAPVGPLSDPELWAIEQKLAAGDARGVPDRLNELERARGSSAAIRYLRARAALVGGEAPPSSVAQALSAIANEDRKFHEAELVAARAWLAAGEDAYARHFARRIADDDTARDSERLIALEILDATSPTSRSHAPPPVAPVAPAAAPPPATTAFPAEPLPPRAAQPDPVPAFATPAPTPSPSPAYVVHGAFPHEILPPDAPLRPPPAARGDVPPGASLPPAATIPPAAPRVVVARPRYDPELVESLALPLGATEDVLAVGDWPTSAIQVRTAMTRLARSLARDYRLWYGSTLRCNVLAVDAMQRHLIQRYSKAKLTDPRVVSELQRHGALLSEILARGLGAEWVDIAPSEPGYWAMFAPPATRCWPIGRVYRFVSLGHTERDLVSYYLDIEARCRG